MYFKFKLFLGLFVAMYINHGDVVEQGGSLGVALDEKPEHWVVSVWIPTRQENNMLPYLTHLSHVNDFHAGMRRFVEDKEVFGKILICDEFCNVVSESVAVVVEH